MTVAHIAISLAALAGTAAVSVGQSDCSQYPDAAGDAVMRRTDPGNDGAVHPNGAMPDVISASVCAWEAFSPSLDPYTGTTVDADDAQLFRLDLVFDGLLNPAGPVLGSEPDPFAFGESPLIGFLDIDVDHRNSGGELGAAAELRYLANVARFGRRPYGSLGERAAASADDLDNNFYTSPQYERTGADFALVLCGCADPVIVSQDGDSDGTFESGETWIIRGRLFERSQGYLEASAAFGGSAPGLYDPEVDVRFSHDIQSDETTVTLVWAIDMAGDALLRGESEQSIDLSVANHVSAIEALSDIIDGADIGGFSGPGWELVERWEGREARDYLEPGDWELTGLFGMPYLDHAEGLYVWTDTLGDETAGDCDGDGAAGVLDESSIRDAVYAADGTGDDADGAANGSWQISNPGVNFSLFDVNGDMLVDIGDIAALRALGDFNWDGLVNTQDFIAYLNAWVGGDVAADFNLDARVDTLDFVAFLNAWVAG